MLARYTFYILIFVLALCSFAAWCSRPASAETGMASWYGYESGGFTANGRRFRPNALSCAHRHYAFGTHLRVTDLRTRRFVVVAVNDRGPAAWTGRVIDLSKGAASRLGMISRGVTLVRITRID